MICLAPRLRAQLCTWPQCFLDYNCSIARYICPYINIYVAMGRFMAVFTTAFLGVMTVKKMFFFCEKFDSLNVCHNISYLSLPRIVL